MKEYIDVVSIVGAGTWGCALANIVIANAEVQLYCATKRNFEVLSTERRHPKLPGFVLNSRIQVKREIDFSISTSAIVIVAVASQYVRSISRLLSKYTSNENIICIASKGIEQNSGKTLSQIIEEEMPGRDVCVLSGGSHAEEVTRDMPFGIVIAGRDNARYLIKKILNGSKAIVACQSEMSTIERLGAIKNLISIATGICDGLGLGDNFRGCFISDAYKEACTCINASLDEALGYGGLGDLVTTALSQNSRNYRYGLLRANGLSHKEAMSKVDMAVEGITLANFLIQSNLTQCRMLNSLSKLVLFEDVITKDKFINMVYHLENPNFLR